MRIITIKETYLKKILEGFPDYPNHGDGVLIYFENDYYFVPLTSKLRTKKNFDIYEKNKYYYFSRINGTKGTLLIQNYIHCNPNLIKAENKSKAANIQLKELLKERDKIEKKLRFQKQYQERTKLHYRKEKLYNDYIDKCSDRSKMINFAKDYMTRAISSMAALEKIPDYKEKINDIIIVKAFSKSIEVDETETILKLKHSWINLKENLLKKDLDLAYIFNLHEIVASHQALYAGQLKKKPNSVSGKYDVPVPKKDIIVKKINNLKLKTGAKILKSALEIFYSIIVHQWFVDGNKRTAFLVINKILIENGIGILMIDDAKQNKFDNLLNLCYEATYGKSDDQKLKIKQQNEFFQFLECDCLIKYVDETEKAN